jgi:hypothetical protein
MIKYLSKWFIIIKYYKYISLTYYKTKFLNQITYFIKLSIFLIAYIFINYSLLLYSTSILCNLLTKFRIPFTKLLTLLIKTFSKPVLAMAKKNQNLQRMIWMNIVFRWVGRKFHNMEFFINSRFRNIQRTTAMKPLS